MTGILYFFDGNWTTKIAKQKAGRKALSRNGDAVRKDAVARRVLEHLQTGDVPIDKRVELQAAYYGEDLVRREGSQQVSQWKNLVRRAGAIQ